MTKPKIESVGLTPAQRQVFCDLQEEYRKKTGCNPDVVMRLKLAEKARKEPLLARGKSGPSEKRRAPKK